MANTYSQIQIQFVFGVKYRRALIDKRWKEELHRYITGIIQNHGHKVLQINSMPDHIHILVGLKPDVNISALVQKVKSESTKWINDNRLAKGKFQWQGGFGAFSYSQSHVDRVIRYIQNQEKHHEKKNFNEEYLEFLKAFGIEYNPEYIFTDPE